MELWSSTLELQLCHARMCDWHATCMGMEGSASLSSCCATCTGQASGLILVVVGHTAGACIGDMIMCTNVARICVRVMACGLGPILRAPPGHDRPSVTRRPVLSDRVTSVTTRGADVVARPSHEN